MATWDNTAALGLGTDEALEARIARIVDGAYHIRLNAFGWVKSRGRGYVGQAFVADVLAVIYLDRLRYRTDDPQWQGRDRFLLSIAHYAIARRRAALEARRHQLPGRTVAPG